MNVRKKASALLLILLKVIAYAKIVSEVVFRVPLNQNIGLTVCINESIFCKASGWNKVVGSRKDILYRSAEVYDFQNMRNERGVKRKKIVYLVLNSGSISRFGDITPVKTCGESFAIPPQVRAGCDVYRVQTNNLETRR